MAARMESLWASLRTLTVLDERPAQVLGLLLATALIAAALWLGLLAPARWPIEGVVTALGFSETETGSYPVLVIRQNGRLTSVTVARNHTCNVGDHVRIEPGAQQPRCWGAAAPL